MKAKQRLFRKTKTQNSLPADLYWNDVTLIWFYAYKLQVKSSKKKEIQKRFKNFYHLKSVPL
jgi:hypothetical protein